MNWAVAGLVYAAVYVGVVLALGDDRHARLLVGNVALLLPPVVPLALVLARSREWAGRHRVFFATLAAWPVLWIAGQIGWTFDEVLRARPLPWFSWHIILQLCGSALPLIALVAAPHRRSRDESAATAAIDIAVLVFLTGFLYWSLIVAPAMEPSRAPNALRWLAIVGPAVRIASAAAFAAAMNDAKQNAWAIVYRWLALGFAVAFAALVVLSRATLTGDYQTGSPGDIGWMVPFWFAASAIAAAPASRREPSSPIARFGANHASPAILFVAIVAVPIIGYGARYFAPAGERIDDLRDVATGLTLVCGVALLMLRLLVERRASARTDEQVRLLAAACEQAGELMLIVRGDRVEYANDAFCRACGYTREELSVLSSWDLLAPESKADAQAMRGALEAGRTVRQPLVLARKDGTTFTAATVVAPIAHTSETVPPFVAVVRDTTEELRLREQLVRSERMSAIGELVSGVAHELNNPLQSVIGTLDLMLGDDHPRQTRQDLERARHEAGRAGRILRNLLAFVRRSPTGRLLTDLNEIVQSTVSVRAYELAQANIQLREEYAPNLPVVFANRDDIQQIILSLVLNAQNAMARAGNGGVLTMRTFMLGDSAALEVSDTGPSVPPDVARRIFEPFFDANAAGSDVAAGLGLSLAFGIATAHGGALELVPATRGACFRLTLPGAGFPGPAHVY